VKLAWSARDPSCDLADAMRFHGGGSSLLVRPTIRQAIENDVSDRLAGVQCIGCLGLHDRAHVRDLNGAKSAGCLTALLARNGVAPLMLAGFHNQTSSDPI